MPRLLMLTLLSALKLVRKNLQILSPGKAPVAVFFAMVALCLIAVLTLTLVQPILSISWAKEERPVLKEEIKTSPFDSKLFSTNQTSTNLPQKKAQRQTVATLAQRGVTRSLPAVERKVKESPSPQTSNGSQEQILEIATRYLGTPYLYGGNSPRGFDCSGFTQYVYQQVGIELPHSSKGQAQSGYKIEVSDLREGDLVFFATDNDGIIDHVGIYAGNGNFIHASRNYGITITTFKEGYYKGKAVACRRVLP